MEITISPIETSIASDLLIVEEFDNLFRLTKYGYILDEAEILSVVLVNINRFYERVIKEILCYVAVGREVVFFIKDNHHLTWFGLKSVIEKLYPNQFKLVEQIKEEETHYIRYQRYQPAPRYLWEKHTGWTYGLLTLGKRRSKVEKFIHSIIALGGENYEILIVTPNHIEWLDPYEQVEQIIFSEKDDLGWITRKKNIICQKARYSDILVCHDRFFLSGNYLQDFQRWGYRYGIATPKIFIPKLGVRGLDWGVVSSENHTWSQGGLMNYRAYSNFVYCPGGATIIRKSAWEKFPWNENLFWNEHEDVELSRRMQRSGEVIFLADALIFAEEDRWVNHNQYIDFDVDCEVLPGNPVGQNRIRYLPINSKGK